MIGRQQIIHKAWGLRATATLLALLVSHPSVAQTDAPSTLYGNSATSNDARFGAQLGAGSQWDSGSSAGKPSSGQVAFGGGMRLGCNGVDLNGFLRSFDPKEIIAEIRTSLLNGAQAAASNYLITLAYANPTISSVLDMMDKRYSARFSAFAQACDAQSARARGQDRGARAMAEAGDQCFDQETARGTAPSEAYRRCSIQRSFNAFDIPATASTADFLRRFTNLNVTRELEALLALLPDQRVQGGAYQMQPPRLTVTGFSDRIRNQTRVALDRMDSGTAPSDIATCGPDDILASEPGRSGCLPASAITLVTSSAFRSSRLLGDTSRTLFKDALSSQIALGALYAGLLGLSQQIARIDVKPDRNSDAAHTAMRRQQLQESVSQLLQEAEIQVKAQAAKMQLVRMQMLALEQVESDMDAGVRQRDDQNRRPQFGMRDLLGLLSGKR